MMTTFRAIVNLDEDDDVVCFCPYEKYLKGDCRCRNQGLDCPEAEVDITVMPNSRPSDQSKSEIKKVVREVKKVNRDLKNAAGRIKQGVSQLEKATKNSRWRI
jgi:hypothetical protein